MILITKFGSVNRLNIRPAKTMCNLMPAICNCRLNRILSPGISLFSKPHKNLLVRFKKPYALSTQIRRQLLQVSPAEWLELNELALKMNMSEATMQRRLKSEGVSYQQLKNEIRRDTAIELLTRTEQSLQEISVISLTFRNPVHFIVHSKSGLASVQARIDKIILDNLYKLQTLKILPKILGILSIYFYYDYIFQALKHILAGLHSHPESFAIYPRIDYFSFNL